MYSRIDPSSVACLLSLYEHQTVRTDCDPDSAKYLNPCLTLNVNNPIVFNLALHACY